MYKDLIKIIDENLRYLKSCLDLTEAHITWGTKNVKTKYSKIKKDILKKMKEERVMREQREKEKESLSPTDRIRNTFWTKD